MSKLKIKRKIKFKHILITLFILLIILLALILILDSYIKSYSQDKIISAKQASTLNADCILVLGAGIWDNTRPSAMLEDRLLQGIELYNNGSSYKILMSGDHGRTNYDEVNVMKQYAIEKNVPSENIFMDHAGFSTYESMFRAKEIFKAKKIIIVTQEYHLYRAIYIAEKLGLEAYGVASDKRNYLNKEYREVREILARVKDFFYVIIKPKPTYLGDAIPVNGDGNITND